MNDEQFSGYVWKRSKITQLLQKRFLSLKGTILYSFRDPPFPLVFSQATLKWDVGDANFSLKSNGFSIILGAETLQFVNGPRESKAWLNAFFRIKYPVLPIARLYLKLESRDCIVDIECNSRLLERGKYYEIPLYSHQPNEVIIFRLDPATSVKWSLSSLLKDNHFRTLAIENEIEFTVKYSASLRNYVLPIPLVEYEQFSWKNLKAEYRRLTVILEYFAEFQNKFNSCLEWRNPWWSSFTLVVLSFLILKLPKYLPPTFILFLIYISVSTGYQKSKLTVARRTSLENMGEDEAGDPSYIYENQRRLFGQSSFQSNNLLVLDRPAYSDDVGNPLYLKPDARYYKIEVSNETDTNGWMYAIHWSTTWTSSSSLLTFVRRRLWRRFALRKRASLASNGSDLSAASEDAELEAAPIENEAQETTVALTGFVNDFNSLAIKIQRSLQGINTCFESYISLFSWLDPTISAGCAASLAIICIVLLFFSPTWISWLTVVSFYASGYKRGKRREKLLKSIIRAAEENGFGIVLDPSALSNQISKKLRIQISVKQLGMDIEEFSQEILDSGFSEFPDWIRRESFDLILGHAPSLKNSSLALPSHMPSNIPGEE
jgi:hypothetical protein